MRLRKDEYRMNKDYAKYKADQLLSDDYFLESELHPTDNNTKYWQQLQLQNTQLGEEINMARIFLKNIKKDSDTPHLPTEANKKLWKQIQTVNKQYDFRKKYYHYIKISTAIAASVCLVLVYGWYSQSSDKQDIDYEAIIETSPNTENPSNKVQLVLSDAKTLSIEGKETQVEYQKEGNLSINSKNVTVEKEKQNEALAFNQLIVPVGKRSSITFTDGTKLWVNSGSKVVYPVKFADNKREIFVEGEIYLNVSHDTQKPFIVKTRKMDIQVLGTQFNISAYENEPDQKVVLVNGKVDVTVKGKEKNKLNPNQMFHYNELTDKSNIATVNVYDYVAWKDGYYQFSQQKLNIVLGMLSKYYGVRINWNKQIDELTCSGKLDLKDDLAEVFNTLQKAAPIQVKQNNEIIEIDVKP